jgi:hypothetical protein
MTTLKTHRSLLLAGALLLPALLAVPAAARADAPDPRWLPWLGCWQPQAPDGADALQPDAGAAGSVVCVVPTSSAEAVEVLTIRDGAVAERERLAVGETRRDEEGCSGAERIEWSADGRRLYRSSDQRCTGGTQRRSDGMLAILPSGQWLSAQGVTVGPSTMVRVLHYRPLPLSDDLPAEARTALRGNALAVDAARSAAAAAPSTADIVEASRHLDADVVGAWLIERGHGYRVDGDRLVELADAGVPSKVIDLMVALSYPDVFAIDRESVQGERRPGDRGDDYRRRRPTIWDPWGYDPAFGWGYYPRYGYGYGYGGYGYRYGYYRPAVVVVRESERSRGHAVNGRGYTRRASGNGGSSSSPSSRPSTTRSSGGGGGSHSGTSTGRTAKPRGN